MKMGFGNGIGFAFDDALTLDELFGYAYGSFVLEMADGIGGQALLGDTTADGSFSYARRSPVPDSGSAALYEDKLESVYAMQHPAPRCRRMETFCLRSFPAESPRRARLPSPRC